MSNLYFVDVEARGTSPVNGIMTEFGVVHYETRKTFHGVLYEGTPDPTNPAVPVVGKRVADDAQVAEALSIWMWDINHQEPKFVSDNVAYDWMWIAGMYDRAGQINPFGHSGRRISDFWAGLNNKWGDTQRWKTMRKTVHDHNPVNDAMGNVEAFEKIMQMTEDRRKATKDAVTILNQFHRAGGRDYDNEQDVLIDEIIEGLDYGNKKR